MSIESASHGQSPSPQSHPDDSLRRHALCIGLTRFGPQLDEGLEPPADRWGPLPFAEAVTEELAAALAKSGYECTIRGRADIPDAEHLGSAVRAAVAQAGAGIQLVHVLSHGVDEPEGVFVVGADGCFDDTTGVESWIAAAQRHSRREDAHYLFVVDTCYSGQAARLDWLRSATTSTRAWVIAATQPGELAFDGRLTTAMTTVLRRIQDGDLDFSPSPYVPFVHLVTHVGQEVARLGGEPQYVTGTPSDRFLVPPFIVNPRRGGSDIKGLVDSLAGAFTDLDVALDPAHFLDRAAGHRDSELTQSIGCFTGREDQLEELSASLKPAAHPCGLTVVTGGAGSGKSALLGVLVCALHPRLRSRTEIYWKDVAVPAAAWDGPLAAIHLRERTLAEASAALVRQLDLPLAEDADTSAVVTAVGHMPTPPLLIFDALDEAVDQDDVHRQLLLRLAPLSVRLW